MRLFALRTFALGCCALLGSVPGAADERPSMTVAQVRAVLTASAASGRPATLAGKRLINLNLDGLDFRKANFKGADLLETSFRNANLSGARFDGANMSAVKLAGANARNAHLVGVTFLTTAENVDMRGADLSRSSGYLIAPGGDFSGANLSGAQLSPEMSNQPMGLLHTIFAQARLDGANLSHANLSFANLSNASLTKADLRDAIFVQSDLSRADFSGADLTGADLTKADLSGAIFAHVRGRQAIRGLKEALNVDQAIFR